MRVSRVFFSVLWLVEVLERTTRNKTPRLDGFVVVMSSVGPFGEDQVIHSAAD